MLADDQPLYHEESKLEASDVNFTIPVFLLMTMGPIYKIDSDRERPYLELNVSNLQPKSELGSEKE